MAPPPACSSLRDPGLALLVNDGPCSRSRSAGHRLVALLLVLLHVVVLVDPPCVLAADPSGLFLVLAPPSVSERPPTEARACLGPDGVERTIHVGRRPKPACFVLDVPAGAASRVPDPDFLNDSTVGVIAAPGGGGGYMVVEFQNTVGCDDATLICFSSETGEWVEVDVDNPLPDWIWTFDDVVSHDGKLWWVNRAKGLLACDPFADEPDMAYVRLPKGGRARRRNARLLPPIRRARKRLRQEPAQPPPHDRRGVQGTYSTSHSFRLRLFHFRRFHLIRFVYGFFVNELKLTGSEAGQLAIGAALANDMASLTALSIIIVTHTVYGGAPVPKKTELSPAFKAVRLAAMAATAWVPVRQQPVSLLNRLKRGCQYISKYELCGMLIIVVFLSQLEHVVKGGKEAK